MPFSLTTVRRNVTGSVSGEGKEIERPRVRFLFLLSILVSFLVAACALKEPPHPSPDPMQEQIKRLQKQILELQKVQNDTRSKLDDVFATMATLATNISALETKVHALHREGGTTKSTSRRTTRKKKRRN